MRGPNVPKAEKDCIASYGMVDLSRTILDLAGATPDYEDDGVGINLHNGDAEPAHSLARQSLSEYWVTAVEEGKYGTSLRENSTYRTLRIHDEADNSLTYSYSVWCTGERELYDLTTDRYQVRNLLAEHNEAGPFAQIDTLSPDLERVTNRVDGLMLVLKTCEGAPCGAPWATLFPKGEVKSLAEALDAKYDKYFTSLPKVKFDQCALGYQARREHPLWQDSWAYVGRTHGEL